MKNYSVTSPEELTEIVSELGFLPFFKNDIEGFSIEEMCPPELWFAPDRDGPWEWKGPAARTETCVYGKFFKNKAGFISRQWLPCFANYRRDGYDLDSRYDEGLLPQRDKVLFDAIEKNGPILSKHLKEICGYVKGGNKGFDQIITRLQMQTYVCIYDFEYARDKTGKEYGWGIAKYSSPEAIFGYDFVTSDYSTEPKVSKQKLVDHLKNLLPGASEKQILSVIC
ncbi:MAG: hypothetical protein IKZ19_09225 [Clostridia bacterium]|nr:hypothetical protein [Clostridia bacterium]